MGRQGEGQLRKLVAIAALVMIGAVIYAVIALESAPQQTAVQLRWEEAAATPQPTAALPLGVRESVALYRMEEAGLLLFGDDADAHAYTLYPQGKEKGYALQLSLSDGYVTGFTLTCPYVGVDKLPNDALHLEQYIFQRQLEQWAGEKEDLEAALPALISAIAGDRVPFAVLRQWTDAACRAREVQETVTFQEDGGEFSAMLTWDGELVVGFMVG